MKRIFEILKPLNLNFKKVEDYYACDFEFTSMYGDLTSSIFHCVRYY